MLNFPECDIFIQQKWNAQNFWLAGRTRHLNTSSQFPRFVGHPDLPMRKTLRVVQGLPQWGRIGGGVPPHPTIFFETLPIKTDAPHGVPRT